MTATQTTILCVAILFFAWQLSCAERSHKEREQIVDKLFDYKRKSQNGKSSKSKTSDICGVSNTAIGTREIFTYFNERHRHVAGQYIKCMTDMPFDDFTQAMEDLRGVINRGLYIYVLLRLTLVERADLQGVNIPSLPSINTKDYFPTSSITEGNDECQLPQEERTIVDIPCNFTGTNLDPEHQMAYFREDIGFNSYHWNWHIINAVDRNQVDRKGELFFFTHQQIIARYEVMRICRRLYRLRPFDDWSEPLPFAYYPHLTESNSYVNWGTRGENCRVSDVRRYDYGYVIDISTLEEWRRHIMDSIENGTVIDSNNQTTSINNPEGINLLGNLVEPASNSINQGYYGSLHNYGHIVISLCQDPLEKYMENMGVMGNTNVAVRDKVFYMWHKFVDNIFQSHKGRLERYGRTDLSYNDIYIDSLSVVTEDSLENQFITCWEKVVINAYRGLDQLEFGDNQTVYFRFRQLQHLKYAFKMEITNNHEVPMNTTIRLFLLPTEGERGEYMECERQRSLAIELDRFVYTLQPGANEITRDEADSSVTVPFSQTIHNIESPEPGVPSFPDSQCSCGFPQHLHIPIGRQEGIRFLLFAMASNYTDDEVPSSSYDSTSDDSNPSCKYSYTTCGLPNFAPYPDKRNMGFPFDRPIDSCYDFLLWKNEFSNMAVTDVYITHRNETCNGDGESVC